MSLSVIGAEIVAEKGSILKGLRDVNGHNLKIL